MKDLTLSLVQMDIVWEQAAANRRRVEKLLKQCQGSDVIVLRVREPNRERKFKAPLWWLVGGIAIIGCIVFFFSLKSSTQLYFLLWNLFGLAIYLLWSSKNARLAKSPEA